MSHHPSLHLNSLLCLRKVFITVANSFFFVISWLFSFSIILLECRPLLLKNGLVIFQNFLLCDKSFTFSFWKYSVLVLQRRFTKKFLCFFVICPVVFCSVIMINIFFNSDLCIIAFLKPLTEKNCYWSALSFFLLAHVYWGVPWRCFESMNNHSRYGFLNSLEGLFRKS